MGKTLIVPLVLEERTGISWHPFGQWQTKYAGKPTVANLQAFRVKFINSTRKGGCNEHLGITLTGDLRIRRQKDNFILAEYKAPLFEVFD